VLPLTIKGKKVFTELCTLAVRFDQQLDGRRGCGQIDRAAAPADGPFAKKRQTYRLT
jgi:hypothetical protein